MGAAGGVNVALFMSGRRCQCSTVLKELFEATLKRPLIGSRQKTWLQTRHCCFSTASVDASTQLKVLHAASRRPGLRAAPFAAAPAASHRSYCVKTEDAVELEEQLKKDGVKQQ
ncbi:hypothetical protein D9C73_001113 [Collichthys lucidus]|uniref:Uncharacterized protein n=1 Tax=Collichthys lucidus TaxID=240159 RepID=A0A4U5U0N6_COLLU|nr:hypothetical protein D9C73_001113 [Collichthys lucidus]